MLSATVGLALSFPVTTFLTLPVGAFATILGLAIFGRQPGLLADMFQHSLEDITFARAIVGQRFTIVAGGRS